MRQMTQEEYVVQKGVKCPFCGSNNVEGDSVDIDAGGASQGIFCNDCEREWVDTYTLTGYEEVQR